MKNLFIPALLVAITGIHPGAGELQAQERTLGVGDSAPALDVEHWIKGEPVTSFQPGQCYVVEFWATWCAPCKDSMPHLTKLQKELGDQVVIIGLSDEKLDVAKKFLDQPKWAERTQYTLGTDPDRSVHKAYMEAAKQRGIPTSFLVNGEGKIEWIGHPAGMDRPLKRMLGIEVGESESGIEHGFDMGGLMEEEWNSTEAAKPWMEKAVASLRKNGWKYDFLQVTSVQAGMPGEDAEKFPLTRKGTAEYAGDLGTRIDAVTEMDIPMMPEPIQTKQMVVLNQGVYYVKSESQMSMMPPGLHSMTAQEAADLKKEYASMPQPPTIAPFFDPNPIYSDPASNLEQFFTLCALDVADENETRVILRGEGSMMLAMMSAMGKNGEATNPPVELILDKKTGRPIELVVGGGEEPEFTMTFADYIKVEEPDLERFILNLEKRKLPSLVDAIRQQMDMMMQMEGGDGAGVEVDFDDGEEVEF